MKLNIIILTSTAALLMPSCALFNPDYKEFKRQQKEQQEQAITTPYDAPPLPGDVPQLPDVSIPSSTANNPFAIPDIAPSNIPDSIPHQSLPALPGGVGTSGNPLPVIGGPQMNIPLGGGANAFQQTVQHHVVSGDSIWALSRKYNVSQEDIRTANNLTSSMIKVGEVLEIPQP